MLIKISGLLFYTLKREAIEKMILLITKIIIELQKRETTSIPLNTLQVKGE